MGAKASLLRNKRRTRYSSSRATCETECVGETGRASLVEGVITSEISCPRNPLRDHADILQYLMQFASGDGYLFVAGVSKCWRAAWGNRPKETGMNATVQSASRLARSRACGGPWGPAVCSQAAAGGHLETIKWARHWWIDCDWDAKTCAMAARSGHFDVLKWCRANGCPWDREVCTNAASKGYLEMLRWCRANGAPWGDEICARAIEGGHYEVLAWCRANGCS